MKNTDLVKIFHAMAELLSLKNENIFKIKAYENAAQSIESLPESIEQIAKRDELHKIHGVGKGIAEKIKEYIATGKIAYFEDLRADFSPGLLEIMDIPGIGPKKAQLLYNMLKISDIHELEKAANEEKIRNLPGFGIKTEENLLKGISFKKKSKGRILLNEAVLIADEIITAMKTNKNILQISTAGSLRRLKETIGDIDILCSVKKGTEKEVINQFISSSFVKQIVSAGDTKAAVFTDSQVQADLRVVEPESFGAALQYFTGSKEHNVALRGLANDKGLTINEYGVYQSDKKDNPIAGEKEEDVYKSVGLHFIAPQLRENRGEIEAAAANKLPKLIDKKDILGDTHIHSRYSDGSDTIEEIAQKAKALGYKWVVISDHSVSLKVAYGLSIPALEKKIKDIKAFNKSSKDIKILCGAEVDILSDGKLDYPNDILEQLDFTIASIHTGFKQTEHQITERLIKAIENPYIHCIGHPTGRLLNKRDPYAVNIDQILEAASINNKIIEINASPDRLDLYDIYCRKAKEMGIKIAIGSDAHSLEQLGFMHWGIAVAQRGWLEKKDVINTFTYEELIKYLSRNI